MFKRVGIAVGIGAAIILLVATTLMAEVSFWGGAITGGITLRPTQTLAVPPAGPITATQGLTPGDILSIRTTGMTGIVADAGSLTRRATGTIGKAFSQRQAITAITLPTSSAAGIQQTVGSVTVGSSDWANLAGNRGNIRLDTARGADPSLTFTAFTQTAVHDVPAVGPSMAQATGITSALASPATAAQPLSLIGAGEGGGAAGFGGSVASDISRGQEFGSLLAGGVGIYGGEQETQDVVIMESTMEVGTVEPASE